MPGVPRGHAGAHAAVPAAAQAVQLRHAHRLPGAHQYVQVAAQ